MPVDEHRGQRIALVTLGDEERAEAGLGVGVDRVAEAEARDLEQPFRATGTLHIFAVSGLHVALLGVIAAMVAVETICRVALLTPDSISGNAHGMLGAYLVANGLLPVRVGRASFVGRQGESLGRPGEVGVEIEGESGHTRRVRISGTARIVYQATLTL